MQLLIGHGQVPTIMPEASNKVPKKVYDALLRVEVKPYVEIWD